MYNISLLPEKYRLQRERAAQKLDLIIYFVFFTVICLILLTLATLVRCQRLSELGELDGEVAKIRSEIDSLSEYSKKKDNVEHVYNDIKVLASGLPSFPRVLPEILGTVTNNISISSVSMEYALKTAATSMKVKGSALNYEDVAAWITALDELDVTGEIHNTFSTGEEAASAYNISFELEINILDATALDDITWDLGENDSEQAS